MKRITLALIASSFLGILITVPGNAQLNRIRSISQQPSGELYGLKNGHSDMTTAINTQSVDELQLAWQIPTVEEPLSKMIPDFKVDFRGKVVALDAKTGRVVWERLLVEPSN